MANPAQLFPDIAEWGGQIPIYADVNTFPELAEWQGVRPTFENVETFLIRYGYTRYNQSTDEYDWITRRYHDERMPGLMDILIEYNTTFGPLVSVSIAASDGTDRDRRNVAELVHTWNELYQIILDLRKAGHVGSKMDLNYEYLRIIKALHQRLAKLENK